MSQANPFASHPGYDAQGCHLQYVVIPAPYGSSHHGFGCEVTGGHCLPGEQCDKRRAIHPESCGLGDDLMELYEKQGQLRSAEGMLKSYRLHKQPV